MQTKIHEPTQIVEVMLTHAEQADEAVKQQLKELYAQYKARSTPLRCSCPASGICMRIRATCCCSIAAVLPGGQCRHARRQVSEHGQAEEVPRPPLPNFFAACNGE